MAVTQDSLKNPVEVKLLVVPKENKFVGIVFPSSVQVLRKTDMIYMSSEYDSKEAALKSMEAFCDLQRYPFRMLVNPISIRSKIEWIDKACRTVG